MGRLYFLRECCGGAWTIEGRWSWRGHCTGTSWRGYVDVAKGTRWEDEAKRSWRSVSRPQRLLRPWDTFILSPALFCLFLELSLPPRRRVQVLRSLTDWLERRSNWFLMASQRIIVAPSRHFDQQASRHAGTAIIMPDRQILFKQTVLSSLI